MKRSELLRYLQRNGAIVLREGRRHTIMARGERKSQVPRHQEIVDELARKICNDLGLPFLR